jgi:hypothetical protein
VAREGFVLARSSGALLAFVAAMSEEDQGGCDHRDGPAQTRSAIIEVVDDRDVLLSRARFGTGRLGYRDTLADGHRFPDRVCGDRGLRRDR